MAAIPTFSSTATPSSPPTSPSAADVPGRQRDVLRLVTGLVAALAPIGRPVAILDCGGGTGRLAVPLAEQGATVTVVDISADALATLIRRADEAGVADRVHAVQGDVEGLAEVVATESFDLALLHGVLDVVEPVSALISVRATLVAGGLVSVLSANPVAAILTKVLSGDLDAALTELQAWIGTVSHSGHLDADELARVCAAAGLVVEQVSGVGVFSDLVALASAAPITSAGHAADLSAELEALSCTRSPLRDIASRLHVVARRPVSQS